MPLDQPTFPGEHLLVLTGAGRTLTSAFAVNPSAALDDDPATAASWAAETITGGPVPADIVFVLDRSGSMGDPFGDGTRMDAVIAALETVSATLATAATGTRVAIVSFGAGGTAFGNADSQVESELTDDFAALSDIVATFVPVSGTPTRQGLLSGRAILEARATGEDSFNLPALVLISDGVADDVPGANAAASALITAHPDWKLFAVGIDADSFDSGSMEYIGQTVGDGYFAAASPADLSDILVSIVTVLV